MKENKKKVKILPLTVVFILFIYLLAGAFIVMPKAKISANEKRPLAEFPEVSFESIKSGEFTSGLDTYLADHFPIRDAFVGLNAYVNLALGQNGDSGIYKCKNGYLITAPYKYNDVQIDKNIKYINDFQKSTGLDSSIMIVPTAGYTLNNILPKNHKKYNDDKVFSKIENKIENVDFINLSDFFQNAKNDTQLYYKTDHHLTSSGALSMYQHFCKEKNIKPATFTLSKTVNGFYGTTYSKSGLWLTKPDNIEIWTCDSENSYTVTITENNKSETYNSLYFESHFDNMDKYPVFLDGNHQKVVVKNKNCHNGKRLLLVKDSYAHCFATFLIENYEEIDMIDLRYYHKSVKDIADENNLNEVLFLFGTENFSETNNLFWLGL